MLSFPKTEIDHCPAPEIEALEIVGNLDGILTVSLSAGGLTVIATGNRRQLLGAAEQIFGAIKAMEPGK